MSFNNESFNNESEVKISKRNLRRSNRLQNNSDFTPYENAAFVDDKDNDKSKHSTGKANSRKSLKTDEKKKRYDENKTKPTQKLLESKTASSSRGRNLNSNQSRSETDSVEMKVKDENLTKREGRKVLESINVLPTTNQRTPGVKYDIESDEKETTQPLLQHEKTSKSLLLQNLKKFDAATQNNIHIQDRLQQARPSLAIEMHSRQDSVDYGSFNRSSSMREGKCRLKPPRRLLRDISFSDTDASTTRDYGALKNINLPSRLANEPIDLNTVCILESLMHELIKRGKVHQVALVDRKDFSILASIPSGLLNRGDAIGMTKAIACPTNIFKLKLGQHDYGCFKHRHDAVQGRADDIIFVMQMTQTCVVAGFSRNDAPGSCNSEVHEFTKVLEDAGW